MTDERIRVIKGDITTLVVQAIVNAANEQLSDGAGVNGAIHRAAGPGLAAECARLGGCQTGDAKITGGYQLPARHVIHAVGPVWEGGGAGEADMLAACYHRALELAQEFGCKTVAFPAISTGVFGYPKREAAKVAITSVSDWLADNQTIERVIFCCFDRETAEIYAALLDLGAS
ncbi:MAG: O-acetyl-ADP-ribose deacetylase [Cucumibacter sp.]